MAKNAVVAMVVGFLRWIWLCEWFDYFSDVWVSHINTHTYNWQSKYNLLQVYSNYLDVRLRSARREWMALLFSGMRALRNNSGRCFWKATRVHLSIDSCRGTSCIQFCIWCRVYAINTDQFENSAKKLHIHLHDVHTVATLDLILKTL